MEWWKEAKFGMMIHWGLYSLLAGEWKGQIIPGIAEWIMKRAEIPISEYEKLAEEFNPTDFSAERWVKLAKDAGMKYLVFTSKHHDGFALYNSKCSSYNIADATPFKRDPIKELADACEQEGIKFCLYYSQVQDWHHPDAVGNNWDYPDNSKKKFRRYMEEKLKPQLHELLTQYGPIGLIWFDTPMEISKEKSLELVDFVHELQPDCLINGRIGYGLSDYRSMGDNRIPRTAFEDDWETPATLNDTWGYKESDNNWKNADQLIRLLTKINSRGGNYLLNVGPTAEGIIPEASIDILQTVGNWMKRNGEAIYGTVPAPVLPYELTWGEITAKPGCLYLHVFEWPADSVLTIYEIKNKVKRAYILGNDQEEELEVENRYETARDEYRVVISLPAEPTDEIASVVKLEIEGEPDINPLK